MRKIATHCITLCSLALATSAIAMDTDDPLLTMLKLDQLEFREYSADTALAWDIEGWLGYDLRKLVLKAEGERVKESTESSELQLLYSRALDPNWDLQLGIRHDFYPQPEQSWAVIGFQGLAPFLIATDASLFFGESGQLGLRLDAEYEQLLTQRWVLSPEVEINLHSDNDAPRGIGSGLSDLEAGLRLRYEIRREFAPYIGINWEKKFGNSADFARSQGDDSDETWFVMGIQAWF